MNYIFGYGSLLDRKSRTNTTPEAEDAWPALVKGYSRGWYHQFNNFVGSTCTFLGVEVSDGDQAVNGAIYRVNDMGPVIKREVGYTPAKVDPSRIAMLVEKKFEEGDSVWIFVSNQESISRTKAPTREIPMVQSYVDMCINGCLELEELLKEPFAFAQHFIHSTSGWNEFWVNDRIYPRRPGMYSPNAKQIDETLEEGRVLRYRRPPDSL